MQNVVENTLCKVVIAPKPEGTEASGGKKPSEAVHLEESSLSCSP